MRWDRRWPIYKCVECSHKWNLAPNVKPARTVEYQVTRCPYCKSAKSDITSTRGLKRYHRCSYCQQNFVSEERPSVTS